jgi:hypothetical protein
MPPCPRCDLSLPKGCWCVRPPSDAYPVNMWVRAFLGQTCL